MRQTKKIYVGFVLLISFFVCAKKLSSAAPKGYINLEKIISIDKQISFEPNYLQQTFSLVYQKNQIWFELNKNFLISNGYFIPLQKSAYWKDQQILIPVEMAEEIMSELSLPVKYNFTQKDVSLQSLSKKEKFDNSKKLTFVVIDPGHGGIDGGAMGVQKSLEKDIVLSASTSLFYYLKKEFPQLSVYITRLDDIYLPLNKRSEIANQKQSSNGYGIFISLHCNAIFSPSVNGYEIYYLAQNSQNETIRQLSLKENNYLLGEDLYSQVLQSFLINAQIQKESKVLAKEIDRAFMSQMNSLVSRRGVKKADFSVLRLTLMPAILIEMGYITNAQEEEMLKTKRFHEALNKSIAQGIRSYIKQTGF